MLHLLTPTGPGWLARALADLDAILVDHAHCEKKAASTAVSLLFRYPDHEPLLAPLADLAREELAHFTLVLEHLARRGVPFRRQTPSPYAAALLQVVRPHEPERMLDTFLCLAAIEARSCERMKLLAEHVEDVALAGLYRGLLASEARHYQAYVDLASSVAADDVVRRRQREIAAHEATVIANAPAIARLHA